MMPYRSGSCRSLKQLTHEVRSHLSPGVSHVREDVLRGVESAVAVVRRLGDLKPMDKSGSLNLLLKGGSAGGMK